MNKNKKMLHLSTPRTFACGVKVYRIRGRRTQGEPTTDEISPESRDFSASRSRPRLDTSSTSIAEKHQHSNPGKETTRAGSNISVIEVHR